MKREVLARPTRSPKKDFPTSDETCRRHTVLCNGKFHVSQPTVKKPVWQLSWNAKHIARLNPFLHTPLRKSSLCKPNWIMKELGVLSGCDLSVSAFLLCTTCCTHQCRYCFFRLNDLEVLAVAKQLVILKLSKKILYLAVSPKSLLEKYNQPLWPSWYPRYGDDPGTS